MGLKRLAEKTAEYKERLSSGRADQIKPSHVEKTLAKLRHRSAEIEADIATTQNPDKRTRLTKKLDVATEQIARAQWLLEEIEGL